MLKVTVKGSNAADLLVNLLALVAIMNGTPAEAAAPKAPKTKSDTKTPPPVTETKVEEKPLVDGTKTTVITLADLQAFGTKIQAFKTKDSEKGPLAIAAFKKVVQDAGGTRLSDPNLTADKYPAVKAALEKICTEYGIA